jgi:hypothetical protein
MEMNGSPVFSFEKVCYCCHITLLLKEDNCRFLFTAFTHVPDLLRCREDMIEMTTSILTDYLGLDWIWIQT